MHYQRLKKFGTPIPSIVGTRELKDAAYDYLDLVLKSPSTDACIEWPLGCDSRGYARMDNGKLSHRIMCEMAHGSAPKHKPNALHYCGNGHLGCVNPAHLYWGDQGDNNLDRNRHGRSGASPIPRKDRIFGNPVRRMTLERSGGKCEASGPFYNRAFDDRCGADLSVTKVEFDHFFRVSDGGDNSIENCRAVCPQCHAWKTRNIDIKMAAKSKRIVAASSPPELRKPKRKIAGRKLESRPFTRREK